MQRNFSLVVTATLTMTDAIEDVGCGYRVLVVADNDFVRRRSLRELTRAGFTGLAMTENEAAGFDPAAFDAVLVEPEGNVVDAALEILWSRATATT
jgi:hypothetical protein